MASIALMGRKLKIDVYDGDFKLILELDLTDFEPDFRFSNFENIRIS